MKDIRKAIQIENFSSSQAEQLQNLLDILSGRLCDIAQSLNELESIAPSLVAAIRVHTLDQNLPSLADQLFELATIASDRAKEDA